MATPTVPLDAIRQPVLLYDVGGRIVAANDLAEALAGRPLAGLSVAEMQARIRLRRPGGGEYAPAELPASRALAGEEAIDVPLELPAPDGRTVHVLATASPIRDGDSVTGALVVWRDTTRRVRAEAALRESEARFRSVLDASRDAVYRVNLQTGRYEYISPSCEAVVGYPAEELTAADREAFLWMVHPDDLPAFRAAIEETHRVGHGEAEYRQQSRDGDYRWLSNRMSVLSDDAGRPLYRTGNIRDISRRKGLEAELAESAAREKVADALAGERQRFLAILETLPAIISLISPDHRLVFANRRHRELFGESRGRTCHETCFGSSEPCPFCEAFVPLETGRPHQWECVTPSGRAIEVYNVPFTDTNGAPMILEMDLDVTAQRAAEAALREANAELDERVQARTAALEEANARLREEIAERQRADATLQRYARDLQRSNEELQRFAYVASHDLQEPLRSIVSFSQLLEKRYKGKLDSDADEFIDFIVEGGVRMQRLIQDLLQVSRIETRARPLEPTDAATVVAAALAHVNGRVRDIGGSVTVGPLPQVMADPGQLEQVFVNLVSNAIKYRRPEQPLEITISAERTNRMVEFAVADNGIGIEAEYYDRIFEMFRRLHTHERYEGTGIGLAVVKRIVVRHGGCIWVDSVPGEGSTFFFTLPAV